MPVVSAMFGLSDQQATVCDMLLAPVIEPRQFGLTGSVPLVILAHPLVPDAIHRTRHVHPARGLLHATLRAILAARKHEGRHARVHIASDDVAAARIAGVDVEP